METTVTVSLQAAPAGDATAPREALPAEGAPRLALAQAARRVGRAAAPAVLQPAPAVKPDAERAVVTRQEDPPGRAGKLAAAVKPDVERVAVGRQGDPPGWAGKSEAAVKPDAERAAVGRREDPPGVTVSRTAV